MRGPGWTVRFCLALVLAAGLLGSAAVTLNAAPNPYANKIVFARKGDLYTCDATGRNVRRITSGSSAVDTAPRWSADHRSVYFIRILDDDWSLRRVSGAGGATKVVRVPNPGSEVSGVRRFSAVGPSRDGKHLFVGDTLQFSDFTTVARVLRYNLSTGEAQTLFTDEPSSHDRDFGHVDASRDARTLVIVRFTGATSALHRLDTRSSTMTTLAPSGFTGRVGPKDEVLMTDWPARGSTTLNRVKMSGLIVRRLAHIDGLTPSDEMPYEAFGYSPGGTTVLFGRRGWLYTMPTAGGTAKRIAKDAWTADW